MTDYTTWEADGLTFDVEVVIDPGAIISTLIGCTAVCHARPANGGTTVAGTASIVSATVARVAFVPWSLPAGIVTAQVQITTPGGAKITISETQWTVRPSLAPRP